MLNIPQVLSDFSWTSKNKFLDQSIKATETSIFFSHTRDRQQNTFYDRHDCITLKVRKFEK